VIIRDLIINQCLRNLTYYTKAEYRGVYLPSFVFTVIA